MTSVLPWSVQLSRPVQNVVADLERFRVLLERWQGAQNLVSRETLNEFWTRHVADSLQILPLLPKNAAHVFDLGSGGGFPGLPLAIARIDTGTRFFLSESNLRKTAFLRTAIREIALDAKVLAGRIEAIDPNETGRADVILARALAPLNRLMELAFPLLKPDGILVFHKGRENSREIEEAGANWLFHVVRHQSATDDQGVVLEIGNLHPRS
jgi:16S rRNA (guanine527-N7)-methyltransferase